MISKSWKNLLKYLFIAVVIIVLVLSGYVFYLFDQSARQSEQHNFHYSIHLSYSTILENVTILLPVPELNGTTVLAEPFLNRTVYGIPDDWNLSIEMVNDTRMLAIRAERMVPDYHGYPIAIEPGQSPLPTTLVPGTEYSPDTPILMPVQLGMMHPVVNRSIDTRNPVGKEPVYAPKGVFIPRERDTRARPYEGKEYTHTVPVYVQYTSEKPGDVYIHTSIQGTNSIWRGGWTGNSYADMVTLELKESPGWIDGMGVLLTGEGVYY